MKAGFGVDTSTESLTYRELQARRDLISKRMRDQVIRGPPSSETSGQFQMFRKMDSRLRGAT